MAEINDKTRESVITGLHELLKHIRAEKEQLDAKIKQVESDLIALGDKTFSGKAKRRGWGEGRALVELCLKNNPGKNLSVADISKQVVIPRSSVHSALLKIKATGHAEEVSEGIWKHK